MVVRPCHLIDITERPSRLVSAEIVLDLEPDRLDAIEESWTPSRKRLAVILLREGIDIEHDNWN